jgi:hypothetical protein
LMETGMMTPSSSTVGRVVTKRGFRVLLVATLVILTVQGWSGDTVNIFLPASATTSPLSSFAGFWPLVESLGGLAVWHVAEGALLTVLSVAVLPLSFAWSKSRAVRVASLLGLFFILSAAAGGVEFVLSGLSNGGNSAQMGGSFIGAYAFYFIALYYSRNTQEAKPN